MDVFEIYKALWKRAQKDGAWVTYNWLPEGMAGSFVPRAEENRQPLIEIQREKVPGEPEVPSRHPEAGRELEELITLAHEYGHFMSFRGRTPPDAYARYNVVVLQRGEIVDRVQDEVEDSEGELTNLDELYMRRGALRDGLTTEAKDLIVREETLAWDVGREVLGELGFTQWEIYEQRRESGLYNHRFLLGLETELPVSSNAE